jgi:hypothetical protein
LRLWDGDRKRFTSKGNHLNHPSAYYHLMAWIGRAADRGPDQVRLLRFVNVFLSAVGVLLMLFAGMVLLPGVAAFTAFASILVMFPKLAVVGGLINNDNLGVIAAGLCFLGFARLHRGHARGTGVLLGIGLALAGWTKLTVLVMVGLALVMTEILRLGTADSAERRWALLLALAIGSFGIIPTIQNWIVYGGPLFIFVAADHNLVPVDARPSLNIVSHGALFLHQLARKWAALEPAQFLQSTGFVLVCTTVVVTAAAWGRDRWKSPAELPGPGGIAAARVLAPAYGWSAAVTLTLHMTFGWRMFLRMGDLTAAQPRYYYAVWPGIALAGALALGLLPSGRWRFYGTIALLLLMVIATIQLAALSAALTGTALTPR